MIRSDNFYNVDNAAKIEARTKYIIHEKQSLVMLVIQFLVTFLGWAILIYCFRDIGIETYDYITGKSSEIIFPKEIFGNFLIYTIISFAIITAWIFYNKWMFGGRDRRKGFPVPSDEIQAGKYGISTKQFQMMRDGKLICVDFDEENKINNVEKADLDRY